MGIAWLSPFNKREARCKQGAGLLKQAPIAPAPNGLYLEFYYACRRHQAAHGVERKIRHVFVSKAALGQAQLAHVWSYGMRNAKHNRGCDAGGENQESPSGEL